MKKLSLIWPFLVDNKKHWIPPVLILIMLFGALAVTSHGENTETTVYQNRD